MVFSGDWIPDHELARSGGIPIDPHTQGPAVDTALRTERQGVFAIGNLVHPVDTADGAALDGAHVAPHVLGFLDGRQPDGAAVDLGPGQGFRWVSPTRFRPGDAGPARGFLLLWPDELHSRPTVVAHQDGREVGRISTWWPAAPGRVFRLPYRVLDGARPSAGPVSLSLHG